MKRNMGKVDRTIRVIVAAILGVLFYQDIISGSIGLVLLFVAFVFVITSFISFCPLYAPFGLSTCSRNSKD